MVTYGPFPQDQCPDNLVEFTKIKAAGFHAIRTFDLPSRHLLDAAGSRGLKVFAGLNWWQFGDFRAHPGIVSSARVKLSGWLRRHGDHPALAGVYVGNEIATDLVRWMGPCHVRGVIEDLIDLGRETAPRLLFAYANYPSTEYLEPGNADFTAFNIYLEDRSEFTTYLRRLQNIAGDRPLVVSEFGLDSRRNSPGEQAETIRWAMEESYSQEAAGITLYSWSDLWQNGKFNVTDWDFGLTDRQFEPKPAYRQCMNFVPPPLPVTGLRYSVIICTRNGEKYIARCLEAVGRLAGPLHEIIVVSDGSTDDTEAIVSARFPHVFLLRIPPSGLSSARNHGAANATGDILAYTDDDCEPDEEWLVRLEKAFENPGVAAAGGPNLPPPATTMVEAVIRSAAGAPSHVLLDDTTAEHLPGCNIAVRKSVFMEIGGFDPDFRTAGDDVDFCWRLDDAGHSLAFVPGAFVWHWRRPFIRKFLKQQIGYGKAEAILATKHPSRFADNGEARWKGFIYGGGAVRAMQDSVIYHGAMGQAGYQSIVNRTLPLRPIDSEFASPLADLLLSFVNLAQSAARSIARGKFPALHLPGPPAARQSQPPSEQMEIFSVEGMERGYFLDLFTRGGWDPASPTAGWDLEKDGTRILLATDYDYHLPDELIASRPLPQRSASRMLVIHRDSGTIEHRMFSEFESYLKPDDLLVLNNTRVIPARLFSDDGRIELLYLDRESPTRWRCLTKPGRKMKTGKTIEIGGITGTVVHVYENGDRLIEWESEVDIHTHGHLALPHYMNRGDEEMDQERYQTVFSKEEGAIAAPTAGLHFTPDMLERIRHDFITLHVGVGTFRPVSVENIKEHEMHSEKYSISRETASNINTAGRVIAVGTTVTRVLESLTGGKSRIEKEESQSGETAIFIHPPYQFGAVDGLLTNFHLPQSTLIMLVSALAGRELTLEAYRQAVERKYRFYSYGDCMLIL
eukprot:g3862.t1